MTHLKEWLQKEIDHTEMLLNLPGDPLETKYCEGVLSAYKDVMRQINLLETTK